MASVPTRACFTPHTRWLNALHTRPPSAATAEPEGTEDPNPLRPTHGLSCELAQSSPDWEVRVPPAGPPVAHSLVSPRPGSRLHQPSW